MATYAEQLSSVRAAIARVESGAQEVHLDGRRLVRADIDALYRREERLVPLAAREAAGRVGPSISRGAGA
jgi:hypothetical protein